MRQKVVRAAIFVFTVAALGSSARADEGMWTFNNFPKDKVAARYGFTPSDAWLEHIRLSSVRIESGGSGGSASFVTPSLVMTNHHVGADCIQKLSKADKDYMREGFLARSRADEVPCPDLEAVVLVGIEDVTAQVEGSKRPGMTQAQVNAAQKVAMAAIEKGCAQKTQSRCDVVTLYQGAVFNLYKYRKYTDVRLVFAPEFQIAFFGGDPDNFTFPRYDMDVAFFRVYEGGTPVSVEHYLTWAKGGARDGDLVFVAGNPGSTGRLLTVAQLELLRDVQYPFTLARLKARQKMLQGYSAHGAEQARTAKKALFGVENSLKAITGYESGLMDAKVMAAKAEQEKGMRQKVAALRGEQARSLASAWDEMARATADFRTFYTEYTTIESLPGRESRLLEVARDLVRLADEKAKPNGERLREYRDSALPRLEQDLFSEAPIYPELETAELAFYLDFLLAQRGAADPLVARVLGNRSPQEAAQAAVAGSKLGDAKARRALAAGGKPALAASNDPLIRLAQALDPEARRLRKRYEDEVESVQKDAGARIAQAQFKANGLAQYPDATFTLRLSFGQVRGYTDKGHAVPWATRLRGLYQRATGKSPYDLPPRWMEHKGTLRLDTPMDLVSTNDIIGGNSGSPLINQAGEVVGLIFDGNLASLPNRFLYTEKQARALSVASQGILEALEKIYDARELVDELRAAGAHATLDANPVHAGQP